MHTPALITMLLSNLLITGVTGYFFWRVLTTNTPPDSVVDEESAEYPRGG